MPFVFIVFIVFLLLHHAKVVFIENKKYKKYNL